MYPIVVAYWYEDNSYRAMKCTSPSTSFGCHGDLIIVFDNEESFRKDYPDAPKWDAFDNASWKGE
jgi:hypothetical protein